MFYGQKELTLDDKYRLVLPSIYRDGFTESTCFATLGMDKCVQLFPKETFEKNASEIMKLSEFSKEARDVRRIFMGNTFNIPIDSHNRILLPKLLMNKVSLGKKVVVVGVYDHLEVWDMEAYYASEKEGEENYSESAKKLLGGKVEYERLQLS